MYLFFRTTYNRLIINEDMTMTYKDLLNQLKTLSEDQLNCDVVVYDAVTNKYNMTAILDLDADEDPFFEIN